jgi:Tfp pilus assembly protein PilF
VSTESGKTQEYYFWRGKAYYWCYEGGKSEEDYLEAVHLDPNNPKYYAELGLIYSSKGDNGKSIHYYETALELKPDFYPAMRNLCNTYVNAGLYSEAVSLLNRLTELAVENGHLKSDRDFIYRKFVEAYHGLGDKEKENYYQRLLQDQGE